MELLITPFFILKIYVSSWLLIIFVELILGLLSSTVKLEGF